MDEIGKLDPVADEEHRDVVAHEVEDALTGVELHGEPTHVAHRVGGAAGADHGGEPGEHRRGAVRLEELGRSDLGRRSVRLEHAMGGRTASVHHPLGDALVVEVRDLLTEVEVLHERRPAGARLQRVIGLLQSLALERRQELAVLGRDRARPRRRNRSTGGCPLVRTGRSRRARGASRSRVLPGLFRCGHAEPPFSWHEGGAAVPTPDRCEPRSRRLVVDEAVLPDELRFADRGQVVRGAPSHEPSSRRQRRLLDDDETVGGLLGHPSLPRCDDDR